MPGLLLAPPRALALAHVVTQRHMSNNEDEFGFAGANERASKGGGAGTGGGSWRGCWLDPVHGWGGAESGHPRGWVRVLLDVGPDTCVHMPGGGGMPGRPAFCALVLCACVLE